MTERSSPLTAAALLEHEGFVRAIVRSLLTEENLVDDVVQETFFKALTAPPRRSGGLRSWLATVAGNLAKNLRRGDVRRRGREQRVARPERVEDVARVVERLSAQRLVVGAVLDLEEPYRETVLLRFYEELPAAEIAARMEVPVATVHTRLRRALAQLRSVLEPHSGGDLWTWAVAAWPGFEREEPLVSQGVGSTGAPLLGGAGAVSAGAWIVGMKAKVAIGGFLVLGTAALTWQALDAPSSPSEVAGDRPISANQAVVAPVPDSGEVARRGARKPKVASAAEDNETPSSGLGAMASRSRVDPACRPERLEGLLEALEQARAAKDEARCESLRQQIASCHDDAVSSVRRSMERREKIVHECVQIMALIGSEAAIEATIGLLAVPELPEASYTSLRSKSFTPLLAERDIARFGEILHSSHAAPGRSMAAELLGYIPSPRSVEVLVEALEGETDAGVIGAIVEALTVLLRTHGLAIPLERMLELVDPETDGLFTLVAAQLPWQESLDWFLHRWSVRRSWSSDPEGFTLLLEKGGIAAEQGVVEAAKRLADDYPQPLNAAYERGKLLNGIDAQGHLLNALRDAADGSYAAPALASYVLDRSPYEQQVEYADYEHFVDTAKGSALLALSIMPQNDAVYAALESILLPGDPQATILSNRLEKYTWSALSNLVGCSDSSKAGRAANLLMRAFDQAPERREKILDTLEKAASWDSIRSSEWSGLILDMLSRLEGLVDDRSRHRLERLRTKLRD